MKWSTSKVNDIKASMTDEENFIDYVFPILRYHSRWSELTSDDTKHIFSKDKVTHNGYYMRVDVAPYEEGIWGEDEEEYPGAFGENAMKYLDKIRKLCEQKGIKLIKVDPKTSMLKRLNFNTNYVKPFLTSFTLLSCYKQILKEAINGCFSGCNGWRQCTRCSNKRSSKSSK